MASPAYFPGGNSPLAGDDELRLIQKRNGQLYDVRGNKGPSYYPEGSKPLASDDEERGLQKINALLS